MSDEGDAEPTATAGALLPESIDAFLDREFATALMAELAKGNLPEEVQKALVEVASSASPDKKAWIIAVGAPPKAVADE